MNNFKSFVLMAICAVMVLNACKKGSNDPIVPGPEPNPPGSGTALSLPKKEMRAVWISTAWGLDWPAGIYGEMQQKQAYMSMLDKFKELRINAIFFQVKAMGDAFYNSAYEPWASSITGVRGKDPGYDILAFLIEEAHKRGVEFHAWMNPYRIATRAGVSSTYPPLHASVPSDWVVSHEKIQIYNPALPEVRSRLVNIVKDLISKYDVDGVHFDDYFYPDPASAGQMTSDQPDYLKYGQGYTSIEAFRRANVDKAIQDVHDAIVSTRPSVVFSVSPAANKDYNYNTLYADVAKWCQEGWLDLLIPQLYQEIGNKSNDFQTNLSIWSQYNFSAALVIGHAIYKFGDATQAPAFQSAAELEKQFDLTKKNKKAVGSALYSAKYIMGNKVGITDKLAGLYKAPAVMPLMGRSTLPAPPSVTNLKVAGGKLSWGKSEGTRAVVYYFTDLKVEGSVLAVTDASEFPISQKGYYCVSLINEDNKEGEVSKPVKF
ncbi:glycoside hydrolase family 10 protein [Sphingobacterium thalpophilum]|uniref:glycoside hydrolase family 10 protein n=1 Tax=Sphingobacterium thalpophilum TaxID=259 RepID=UPI003C70FC01